MCGFTIPETQTNTLKQFKISTKSSAFPSDIFGTRHITTILYQGALIFGIGLAILFVLHGSLTNSLHLPKLLTGAGILIYLTLAYTAARHQHEKLAGIMIAGVFYALSLIVLLLWGINSGVGLLLMGFFIFITGIMLGIRSILPATVCSILAIITIHSIHAAGLLTPNREALAMRSHFGDIVTYCGFFFIFGLVSWITSRHIATSFRRARWAEHRLTQQKTELARKLARESKKLRQAQLEEIQQLYRFAEIGQSTSAILHELANHLSVLNFDIDDLAERHQNTEAISHAKESMRHINSLIKISREKIRSRTKLVRFNTLALTKRLVHELPAKTKAIQIHIDSDTSQRYNILGDPASMTHVLTILINNACDALLSQKNPFPKVHIRFSSDAMKTNINITDNGPGIPADKRKLLFQPVISTKENGLGIGLYIARHIIKSQFGGSLLLEQSDHGASFTVMIPHAKTKKTR